MNLFEKITTVTRRHSFVLIACTIFIFASISYLLSVKAYGSSTSDVKTTSSTTESSTIAEEISKEVNDVTLLSTAKITDVTKTDSEKDVKSEIQKTEPVICYTAIEEEAKGKKRLEEAKKREEERQQETVVIASAATEETTEAPVETYVEPESSTDAPTEAEVTPEDATEASDNGYTYLGGYSLTAYCPCSICCGQWAGGPTKSGNMPCAGHTVACNSLPLGTVIYIEGYGTYVVEDTGGMGHSVIDIFFNTHDEALAFGSGYADVYIVN